MESTIILWGPFAISAFSLTFSVAAVAATLLALLEGQRKLLPGARMVDFSILTLAFGIAGGRLLYIIAVSQHNYRQEPALIFHLQDGGISFWGGFIAAFLALSVWSLLRKNNLARYLDAAAPALALGLAIGRIGYPMQGRTTAFSLPWAIPMDGKLVHPEGAYAIVLLMLLFIIIWRRRLKSRYDGELISWFVMGYALYNLLTDYFREITTIVWGLGLGQLASVAAFLLAALYLLLVPKNYISSRFFNSRMNSRSSRLANLGSAFFFAALLAVFVAFYYLVNGLPAFMTAL